MDARSAAVVIVVFSSIVVGVATKAVAHDESSPLQLLLRERGDAWDSPARSTVGRTEPERASIVAEAVGTGRADRPLRRLRVTQASRRHGGPTMARAKEKALALATPRPATTGLSLYEDPTLRRGDAIMTVEGLRVFEGSETFPYLRSDFSPLDSSHSIRNRLRKILMAYDHQVPTRREDIADLRDMTIRVPAPPHG